MTAADGAPAADVQSLYPFLYAESSDVEAIIEQVRRSTVAKAEEITTLRATVLDADGPRLEECAARMAERFRTGGRLFTFGNGGSATDAEDLAGVFTCPGGGTRRLPAFGLTNDVAVITALSNDIGFDVIFARQIAVFGRSGDVAVGLSTSGNSTNLLRAFDESARRGLFTVGIAGYDGGKMTELDSIDRLFVVPSASVHRIQEAQTTVYHALWELTLAALEG